MNRLGGLGLIEQKDCMQNVLREDMDRLLSATYIDWDKLKDGSFLVTGATGLIGSLFVKTLCHFRKQTGADIKVYILARSLDKAQKVYGKDEQINVIIGDVREPIQLKDSVDYIIHAASMTTSKYMVTNPVETFMTSVQGTYNLLQLAREKSVKGFIYLSSMEVYGVTTEDMNPITEDKLGKIDILNVRSSYSEGKRACELLCASYAQEYGVPIKIARLAQTFGAGVKKTENKVYASFIKSALRNEDIILHTAGESMGNYCYTADCVGALLCMLTRGEIGEAYTIVNSSNSMKIKDMAALVSANWGGHVVFDIPEGNMHGYAPASCMRLSGEKMERLGWKASVGLEEMYHRMITSWDEESYE